MNSNFSFLKDNFPVLANFGALAEKYCYSDSNSSLMKLGMIGETIVNLIFTYDRIQRPAEDNAAKRITVLSREGLITRDLADILHALRQKRNLAAHENYESVNDAKALLEMAYGLCEWFMGVYVDYAYQPRPFVMPSPEEAVAIRQADDEREEEKLVRDAEKTAAESEAVKPEERKKQSQKVATSRVKSEAETRYMIDEQLRKVGWEADTETLRYAKGTRPQKGKISPSPNGRRATERKTKASPTTRFSPGSTSSPSSRQRPPTKTFPRSLTTSAKNTRGTSAPRTSPIKSARGASTRFRLSSRRTAGPTSNSTKRNPASGSSTCAAPTTRRKPCTAGSAPTALKRFWKKTSSKETKISTKCPTTSCATRTG